MDVQDFKLGETVIVMTSTLYWVGRVSQISFDFLTLTEASWIPDTGRLHEAIAKGNLNEVEPVGRTRIGIASITNVLDWNHPLPTKAK